MQTCVCVRECIYYVLAVNNSLKHSLTHSFTHSLTHSLVTFETLLTLLTIEKNNPNIQSILLVAIQLRLTLTRDNILVIFFPLLELNGSRLIYLVCLSHCMVRC